MSGAAPLAVAGSEADLEEGTVFAPRFDAAGLITAVVTEASHGGLLMVAHMNAEALDLTLTTGIAHYYSRSRRTLWKKGETSGALQKVREIRVDCDQDALWVKVDVTRPEETCHTHRESCFYRVVDTTGDGRTLRMDPALSPHRKSANA